MSLSISQYIDISFRRNVLESSKMYYQISSYINSNSSIWTENTIGDTIGDTIRKIYDYVKNLLVKLWNWIKSIFKTPIENLAKRLLKSPEFVKAAKRFDMEIIRNVNTKIPEMEVSLKFVTSSLYFALSEYENTVASFKSVELVVERLNKELNAIGSEVKSRFENYTYRNTGNSEENNVEISNNINIKLDRAKLLQSKSSNLTVVLKRFAEYNSKILEAIKYVNENLDKEES